MTERDRDVILMDIEGTTTSISFVHDVLFPYARARMATFIADKCNRAEVRACLDEVVETVRSETGAATTDVAETLVAWIDEDRKHGALKRLQGMIWKHGYEAGDYTAHLYEDVVPCWRDWRAAGKRLAIYSSGSVQAQKLLFGHTRDGDLTAMISAWFDTTSGHKRETESYRGIARGLAVAPGRVLFLSDVTQELDAARAAGMGTVQLVRPGTLPGGDHPTAPDFHAVTV